MEVAPSCSEAGCGSGAEKDEGPVNCGIELPGFRFHPTDDELVSFYLRRRVLRQNGEKDHALPAVQRLIPDLDIYKYDPWDLPRLARLGEGSMGCYFFSPRDRKYRNSTRPNRVTLSGFWKATGTDRRVYSGGAISECVGLKKSLVFYLGRASKGTKTDWMMHEFRLSQPECSQKDTCWALCRIFKKKSNNSQCISEMQAFAAEELPCVTEGTLNKSEGLDSFGGEDCNEEDSKSETNVCASLTPTYNGPMSAAVDIHTPSSYTSQDDLATADCIVISPKTTECVAPSSMKTEPLADCDAPPSMKNMEPLTLRINKGPNVWADDLLSCWFSPAITRPLESSRFSGQHCVWGDANSLFTNQSSQDSLQVFEPECLGQLSSSPQWNSALQLWDQPAYFQDSMRHEPQYSELM